MAKLPAKSPEEPKIHLEKYLTVSVVSEAQKAILLSQYKDQMNTKSEWSSIAQYIMEKPVRQ